MTGGSTLADLLLDLDMSQTELAERSGVPRETINHLCRGVILKTRSSIVIALAWALDVELGVLAEYLDSWPLGPRSAGDNYETIPTDWVKELRRGRDPFVERAS